VYKRQEEVELQRHAKSKVMVPPDFDTPLTETLEVVFELVILPDGTTHDVKILSINQPERADAVLSAMQQSLYYPAYFEDEAVAARYKQPMFYATPIE